MITRTCSLVTLTTITILCAQLAGANQADDTTIKIESHVAGSTPFLSQVTLNASNTGVIRDIQVTITSKTGSVTRPLSASYSNSYLTDRGYLQPETGDIFLPVYGLYAGYTNVVTLTYHFLDGSSKQAGLTITTTAFDDPCGYNHPTILQARTKSTSLSYDYMLVKDACSDFSPAIMDTDGALRWVGTAGVEKTCSTFFDNAIYVAGDGGLYRIDLDGTFSFLASNADLGVTYIHHNFDLGKNGVIMDVNADNQLESVNLEVDAAGNVLKKWNLADIISAAMIAGGDDPSQFVYPFPIDWFHNNATAYNRADDSLIVSSRENFLICIDYETSAIKWILGDPTKQWHQFPSLAKYALTLAPGSLPPIGQHACSITYDQNVMVLDNGESSKAHVPPGDRRTYASPRRYQIDPEAKLATEVWNYPMDESIFDPFCSSVYEDAPSSYLIDYSLVNGAGLDISYAQLLGLDTSGAKVFYYQYPTTVCHEAFNAIPLHLENTKFPAVGPQALNLSTRGMVSSGEGALIGGFIVTGIVPKKIVLRVLGPSLGDSGLTDTLADPVLTLFDSAGVVIASNDDWASDPGASELTADGLAPKDPAEAATVQTLAPGAYTVVSTGKDKTPGIGLVEAYDLSPGSYSKMANISTRGSVETGDSVMIAGFIVGDVANATVIVRALGPSLASSGVSQPLADPTLTIFDQNGASISSNDNWQESVNAGDIEQNGLAPTNAAEAATVLFLPAGAYSAIVAGADGITGVGLVEVYDLD
jgi:arylsulfate sulfotransferase